MSGGNGGVLCRPFGVGPGGKGPAKSCRRRSTRSVCSGSSRGARISRNRPRPEGMAARRLRVPAPKALTFTLWG